MEWIEDVDEDEEDGDQNRHSAGYNIRRNQKASLFVDHEKDDVKFWGSLYNDNNTVIMNK